MILVCFAESQMVTEMEIRLLGSISHCSDAATGRERKSAERRVQCAHIAASASPLCESKETAMVLRIQIFAHEKPEHGDLWELHFKTCQRCMLSVHVSCLWYPRFIPCREVDMIELIMP